MGNNDATRSGDAENPNDSEGNGSNTRSRRRGRPRGSFIADIPWLEIEKAYVYGDPLEGSENDPAMVERRRYPSLRELGERYGVHYSLIGRKARSLNWLKRRETFKNALAEETDRAVAKAAALSTADAVGLIDTWIGRFEENLRSKRVRADNVSDLNTIMRLREFLLGNADQRSETNTTISLNAMQERFRARQADREQATEAHAAAALAGVVVEDAPRHVLDVAADPAPDGGEGVHRGAGSAAESTDDPPESTDDPPETTPRRSRDTA